MKTAAIIEARMGSSRLPGKMMMDVAGKPALARVFERLGRAKKVDQIVLATTTDAEDDVLEELAHLEDIEVFRGSVDDVLGRLAGASRFVDADIVAEVTGDCILLDWMLIDEAVDVYLRGDFNLITNVMPDLWTYPQGVDVFVFGSEDLYTADRQADDVAHRENPAFFLQEHPERYKPYFIKAPEAFTQPNWRFQLDYEEDLEFIRTVYQMLYVKKPDFTLEDIFALIAKHPELPQINIHKEEKALRGEGSRSLQE
jgi:spore coat polysaccharide biosynthesis protein SpsF